MIKVAIIGGGLSGLSCAHELERYDISPVIFEDLNFIGDRESHVTANLNIADRPIKDLLDYYKETLHLDIKPITTIKKLTHYTENKKVIVNSENFGYFFLRGKEYNSFKGQLYSKLKNTKIIFGVKPDFRALSKEYDYVVVANMVPDISKKLGCWKELISGWIKGATVYGEFNPHELIMWLNRKYCKNGYAYLCPYDINRGSLSLFVPYVNKREIEYYWKKFMEIEKLEYKILEEYYIEHFSGEVYTHTIENFYLVGGAGGAISPFLGFGQVNSIVMGVFAAQSIVEGFDYEELIKDVIDKEKSFLKIREAFDKLTNKGFDQLLASIGFPGVKQMIYDTDINIIKHIGTALKIKDKLKR